jgi:ribonucleoside-triphosphate reductase
MCCRLRLDLRELRKKGGGFFGSGSNTGSIGVVTLNLPRLAHTTHSEEEFFTELDKLMDISARSLSIKRKLVSKLLEGGLYPYTKVYLGTFDNHFSTIGLTGMNEATLNAEWIQKDLTTREAQEFSIKVLNHMRTRLSDYQEIYGDLYNLEATPAESTAYRFAKHDKKNFPNIITAVASNGTPFYTNSTHLPVGYTESVSEALNIQDEMQTLYTSGTVFHTFLGQKLPSWQTAATLVRKIAENYKLPYFTISPTYSICPTHGYITGEVPVCPTCKRETEVYSRITGYYRPLKNWNDGKKAEFFSRKEYQPIFDGESAETAFSDVNLNKDTISGEYLLFTTKTCPNCRMVKTVLDDKKLAYVVIDAEENIEMSKFYNIRSVPTLIHRDDIHYETYINYSNIVRHLSSKND